VDKDINKAEEVRRILMECLYTEEETNGGQEVPKDAVLVEGIVNNFGFHPERLEAHREQVRELLNEMPDDFHAGKGGGMSFLQMCVDKHGQHWAEHPTLGALLALGIGLKMAVFPLPRQVWGILPGGVPYVIIDTREHKEEASVDATA
jgi:hypothetical protein